MLTIDFKTFRINNGEHILDAGCGEGRHTFASCRFPCSVYAIDLDMKGLLKTKWVLGEMKRRGELKGRVMILKGNTLRLPFKDNFFDKVICSEVLEHVEDDGQVIAELTRVLRTYGEMAVSVPTLFTEKAYKRLSKRYFNTPGGHIRIYHPKRLISMMRENSLWVYAIRHEHAFHSFYWVLRCLSGLDNNNKLIPSIYHRFLQMVVLDKRLSAMERMCNLFFPKSIALYAKKV
jgi:ubiquinone/menaquinone biosynthesis C-methylase UbiE